jgi:hypothetical protein
VISSRRIRWGGHVAHGTYGRGQKYTHVKRWLGLPRRRWEENIKIGLKNKMGWSGLDESGSEGGEMAVCCEERE